MSEPFEIIVEHEGEENLPAELLLHGYSYQIKVRLGRAGNPF